MQRIQSFDLARGFTVLAMPMTHTVMLYSTPEVHQSLLGIVLTFIAEGPGAQFFMLLMGVNFSLKSSSEGQPPGCERSSFRRRSVLKKSLYLFIAAYLLNIFKFILPLAFGFLPSTLLKELHQPNDLSAAPFFFCIGDILHFAAIAMIILHIVTRTRFYPLIAAVFAVILIFLSPYLWDRSPGIATLDHFIGLFNAHPPQTFFPVLPWIVYPLIGLTFGYALSNFNKEQVLKRSAFIGAALVCLSLALPATPAETEYLSFYRSRPADTVFHLGIVLLWLQGWNWLSKRIQPNPLFKLLIYCSRHITTIYIIQWILICWCMAFTGYGRLGLTESVVWMVAITIVTLLLTLLYNHVQTFIRANRKSI